MGKATLTIAIGGEYNGKAIERAEAALRNLNVEAARHAGGLTQTLAGAGDSLVEFGNNLQHIGSKAEAMGAKLTRLTAPLAAVGAASVKLAADYQDSVAKVYTIMDKSVMTTDEMSKSILDLSTDTGKAAGELAEATYQALSASVATDKAAGFVADAVKLSKVGFTETATAVDTLTTVINAYGYSAEDAEMIAGRLVQTQNKGKTTVDELAQSMGNVIPTAAAYNVSLDNLCSAYVIMTKQGINTANATTAINGMLTELADEGSDVAAILRDQTGKSFGQLMADGMDLGQVLQILNDHVGGNSEAFANLWGNVRASKGALAIANAGAEQFSQAMGDMANSAGLVDQALDDLATPAAKARKALNAVKNTGIELGEEIIGAAAPAISDLADGAQKLYKWFGELDDGTKQAIVRLGALAVATGPVVTLFGKGLTAVGSFASALGTKMQNVAAFSAAMKTAEAEMRAAGATSVGLGTKMKAAASSTGLLTKATTLLKGSLAMVGTAGVLAVVGIIVEKYNEWREHTELVTKATEDLSSVLSSGAQAAGSFSPALESAGASMSDVESAARRCLEAQASLNDETRTAWTELTYASRQVDYYAGVIAELADKEGLTAEEQFKLADAVGNFNNLTGASLSVIDSQNGKLSTTRETVLLLADAWKQEAEAKALEEIYSKYVQQAIEDSINLEEATRKLNEASEGFGIWIGDFPVFADEASVSYHELQGKVRDTTEAMNSANATADEAMRRRQEMASGFASLEDALRSCGVEMSDLGELTEEELAQMQANFDGSLYSIAKTCADQGRDIPAGLAQGIKAGSSKATGAVGTLMKEIVKRAKAEVESNSPSMVMHRLGVDMDAGLGNGLKAATSQPVSAMTSIAQQIKARISGLPSDFQQVGNRSGQGLASALASYAGRVSSSAWSLSSSAQNGISGTPSAFGSTGSNAAWSFAGAIGAASAWSQGRSLADSGRNGLGSVGAWDLGYNLSGSFSAGMLAYNVWSSARSIAQSAYNAIATTLGIASPSKVGIELGGFFGQGLAVGMEGSERLVARQAGRLSDIIEMGAKPDGTFAPLLATAAAAQAAPAASSRVEMHVTVNVNAANAAEGRAVGTSLASALYDEWSRKEATRL